MVLSYIPSPAQGVWYLGPLPIRGYALCIIAGILVAVFWTRRRWQAAGHNPDDIVDVALWAVPFGIVGGRLYHVITDPELYFAAGEQPIRALYIWDGGLGIWGAIALGAVGAWIGCRRRGIRFLAFADVVVPGVVLAQAVGRWGNWFNNELYGGPTSLPWRLQIHQLDVGVGRAALGANGHPLVLGYFQPTFLYEFVWDAALALALVWVDRRWAPGNGRLFAIYIAGYTAGRGWIEALRRDHANHIAGLRLNDWVSIAVFFAAIAWLARRRTSGDRRLY